VPKVCTILAEAWVLFRKTNYTSTMLERLGYCPDASILQKFWKVCEQQLNISGDSIFLLCFAKSMVFSLGLTMMVCSPLRLIEHLPFYLFGRIIFGLSKYIYKP
jgi:hypothetical protein